jgi:hypothetical protein
VGRKSLRLKVATWLVVIAAYGSWRMYLTSPEIAETDREGVVRNASSTGVILTPAAIEQVQALLAREGRDDLRLRVAVQPGGCSGLRYQLFFDDRLFNDDLIVRFGDADNRMSEPDSGHDSGYESGPDE